MDTTGRKLLVLESNSIDISIHMVEDVDIDEHFGSKLLLPKLFRKVELGKLLPKHQVTLKKGMAVQKLHFLKSTLFENFGRNLIYDAPVFVLKTFNDPYH